MNAELDANSIGQVKGVGVYFFTFDPHGVDAHLACTVAESAIERSIDTLWRLSVTVQDFQPDSKDQFHQKM
jgi:hypothetical protein